MGVWSALLLAALIAFLNCAGDAAAKSHHALRAAALYATSASIWIGAMHVRNVPIAKVGALYAVFACVGTTALGVLGFGEKLSGRGWVGVMLGIAAIALIAAEEYGS